MVAFARIVEAVNRGDTEAACRLTSEDAIVIPRRAATEGAYVGHDGVRSWFADNKATFEVFRLDYSDVRDLGRSGPRDWHRPHPGPRKPGGDRCPERRDSNV
jgi:hypothetical protein